MAVTMVEHGVDAVYAFGGILEEMLEQAESIKQTSTVDPPLNKSDIEDFLEQVESMFGSLKSVEQKKRSQYAIIETAVRNAFNNLLVRLF